LNDVCSASIRLRGVDCTGLTPSAAVNSNIPNIISAVDASPKLTVRVGSGLRVLAAELSKCATTSIRVPFGNIICDFG